MEKLFDNFNCLYGEQVQFISVDMIENYQKISTKRIITMGNIDIQVSVLFGDVPAKCQAGVIYNICLSMWFLTSGLIGELDWCLSSMHEVKNNKLSPQIQL